MFAIQRIVVDSAIIFSFSARKEFFRRPLNNGGAIWWNQQIIHNEITPTIVNRKRCQNPVATFANQFEIEKPNKQDCNFVHFAISVSQVVGVWVGILCSCSDVIYCLVQWMSPRDWLRINRKQHRFLHIQLNWSRIKKYVAFQDSQLQSKL